jgi:hypothetical protein
MKAAGRRMQVRTPSGKVTGYWDGATLRTWLAGAWHAMPASTLGEARDALRRVHGQQSVTGHADRSSQNDRTAAETRAQSPQATCEKDLHMHGSCRSQRPDVND